MSLRLSGARQLRDVSRDLARAGSGSRSLKSKTRRNLISAATPIKEDVQRRYRALPADGSVATGLREACANASRIKVASSRSNAVVAIVVDKNRMPVGQAKLPMKIEQGVWRHPVYASGTGGRTGWQWVEQKMPPVVAPAVAHGLPAVAAAINAAVDETARELAAGGR